ncbi:uncharacterized protein A1O9_08809 [Exophiala aquamarina CBS 119918]|uniref:Endonuclease III homolog n=1 Tax=Exophiala aquamarina CBS 119918 TaxID=1182545 RepID=A0A072PI02_9EURO|nr:uncharacterized protein A1O9_08809 [Exophiala aquamarina CBS 119918]KEF55155.1 hypothetical protein A1O9_08809 [Exophiala aquamarina CBS 119918]
MRTSKISQDTTRIFNSISPNTLVSGPTTRSAKRLASFALGYNGEAQGNEEKEGVTERGFKGPSSLDGTSDLSATPDIEDVFLSTTTTTTTTSSATSPIVRASRKRKLGADPSTAVSSTTAAIKQEAVRISRRNIKVEQKQEDEEEKTTPLKNKAKAKPKKPARKHTSPSGTVTVEPPSNWSEIYDIIKAMRERNPTAPVDTMGCEDLYWRAAPPKEKRYHTLTALMLSSQTKDTVTAVAMQRLHKELVPGSQQSAGATADSKAPFGSADEPDYQSMLTVENVINCEAAHLDNLIGKVGFHNNKTKYIKQTAAILQEQYDSDIPDTIEGLVSLPGVGPKMGYLCLSAAWGIDHGIGVDVHVHRITNMWGWHKTRTPEETRLALQAWLPKDRWHQINKMLVGLGQTVCLPIGRRCGDCDLAGSGLCKAEIRGWKPSPTKRAAVVKVQDQFEAAFEGHDMDGIPPALKNEPEPESEHDPSIKVEQ